MEKLTSMQKMKLLALAVAFILVTGVVAQTQLGIFRFDSASQTNGGDNNKKAATAKVAKAQGKTPASASLTDPEQLLKERERLVSKGKSTREVDSQLATAGQLFPAKAQQRILPNNRQELTFGVLDALWQPEDGTFLADKINNAGIEGLLFVEIDAVTHTCKAVLTQSASDNTIQHLSHIFNYTHFEINQ